MIFQQPIKKPDGVFLTTNACCTLSQIIFTDIACIKTYAIKQNVFKRRVLDYFYIYACTTERHKVFVYTTTYVRRVKVVFPGHAFQIVNELYFSHISPLTHPT